MVDWDHQHNNRRYWFFSYFVSSLILGSLRSSIEGIFIDLRQYLAYQKHSFRAIVNYELKLSMNFVGSNRLENISKRSRYLKIPIVISLLFSKYFRRISSFIGSDINDKIW